MNDISIRKIATTPATHHLSPIDRAQDEPHLAAIAKRFSALARHDDLLRRNNSGRNQGITGRAAGIVNQTPFRLSACPTIVDVIGYLLANRC